MKKLVSHITLLACLSTLPACLLDQSPPKTNTQKAGAPPVAGIIGLEDSRGRDAGALFFAIFAKQTDPRSALAPRYAALAATAGTYDDSDSPVCELQREEKDIPAQSSYDDKPAAPGFISVGQLAFGPALQGTMITVPQTARHQYVRRLPGGFPTGVYRVVAEGTRGDGGANTAGEGDVAGFGVFVSMPEELKDVQANGNGIAAPGLVFKKADGIKLEWRAPTLPNDANLIIADITASQQVESKLVTTQLHCVGKESRFDNYHGQISWDLPAEGIQRLPAVENVRLFLARAQVHREASAKIGLRLQGVRTYTGAATLQE